MFILQMKEAQAQFGNYERLFQYINSHPKLNAELRFGTLSEYFDEMKKEVGGAGRWVQTLIVNKE